MTPSEKQATALTGEETSELRGTALRPLEEVAGLRIGRVVLTPAQLREANESLVIATINAQTMTEAAEDAVEKLSFKAEHDDLTGLPNRFLLADRLGQAMELAKRQGKTVGLMYMDLDHFKNVNDSFGHAVGDQLLQEISERLKACVRHSDTVSRQGGDEFVVLLPVVEALDDAALIARKLIKAMAEPHLIEDHRFQVTLSIGISLFPNDGPDLDSIVRNADTAMYQAKEHGGNNYQVFTPDMDRRPDRSQSPEAPVETEFQGPAPEADASQTVVPALNGPQENTPAQTEQDELEEIPESLTLPEREAAVLSCERLTDLREEAAEYRDDAASLLGKALWSQEKAIDLRETSADLRENAVTAREKTLRPKEEAARVQSELSASTQAQLQEANEHLVIATVNAQTMKEAAEKATEQISKMAKLEAHLQEVQKLETLGILAGGVAHDFNNLLTTIMGNTNLASMKVQSDGDPSPHFDAIEKAAMRAADLTRQLLAYAGKANIEMTEVDLGVVIKEITQLLQVSIPSNVSLHFNLAEGLPFVKADATQIFQVLMNFISNAVEASLPDVPGSITIWTREENVDEAATTGLWALPVVPGPYVTLEVKDTGIGMTPDVMARIFEPFFTTKFTGRGLGLAAVMGIIRSHGGGIKLESEPGQGSSFKIFLPTIKSL